MSSRKQRAANEITSGSQPTLDDRSTIDWDKAGTLSILVQGALFQNNLVETASHCQHWRELFPAAEIILVVSVTNVVTGTIENGVYEGLRLLAKHCGDGHLEAALMILIRSCSKIAASDAALPLPPIKRDSPKLNNMNFQIAAAQHGLAMVTGTYVLRIRSDMIFLDRKLLTQYVDGNTLPRGPTGVFKQRVMISWLYTLNPFTIERMPLHFSDWFHLGLTEDVRQIWAVPQVSLRDAIYYKTQPHDPDSNDAERLFDTRLAVEQHVMYHCFKSHFPALKLAYHNDRSSISLAMDILIDNFILCDLVRANCVFDKYSQEFHNLSKRIHCITPDGWRAMAQSRVMPYKDMLSTEVVQAVAARSDPHQSFPLLFEANRLKTRIGEIINGEIVARSQDGTLFYGPYVSLCKGEYTASVQVSRLSGTGSIRLAVTVDGGNTILAKCNFIVRADTPPRLEVTFQVNAPFVSDLEIVCTLKGIRSMAVSGISIAEGDTRERTKSKLSVLRSVLNV